VAHIRPRGVIFIFDGRNSGQQKHEGEKGRSPESANRVRIWVADGARAFQIVPNNVQLLECCAESGRSSETAKMQDWPSNWILSAE